tara:strand:- start:81 stop:485 length:405 start_codon:yes stop_codon:yes gene_type:complete
MDNNFLFAVMWYVMGIISYKIVTNLLNYGNMINVYNEILISTLLLLKMADENFERGNLFLGESSVEAGVQEENVRLEKDNNENILSIWREMVVNSIILTTAPQFRRLIKFKNWNEAMRYLKSHGDKNEFFKEKE